MSLSGSSNMMNAINNYKNNMTVENLDCCIYFICQEVKGKHRVDIACLDSCRKCKEVCIDSCHIFSGAGIGFDFIQFSKLGLKDPYHVALFVKGYSDQGITYYIYDPTYVQFNDKHYCIDKGCYYQGPGNYMDEEVRDQLIRNGFLPLTTQNMKAYIDSFIDAYNNRSDIDVKLSKEDVYSILSDHLDEFGFSFDYRASSRN